MVLPLTKVRHYTQSVVILLDSFISVTIIVKKKKLKQKKFQSYFWQMEVYLCLPVGHFFRYVYTVA